MNIIRCSRLTMCSLVYAFLMLFIIADIAKGEEMIGGNNALVFLSPAGSVRIALVKDAGIDIRQLSDPDCEIEYISTASNGKCTWVAYKQGQLIEGWNTYAPLDVYIVDGERLSIPQHDVCPIALSPDGSRLLFIADDERHQKLQCLDLKTKAVETIVNNCRCLQRPSWSPDGTKVAYFCSLDRTGYRLHVTDMSTKKDVELSSPTLAITYSGNIMDDIRWSYDGKLIFFSARYDTENTLPVGSPSTYVVPVDGSNAPVKIGQGSIAYMSQDRRTLNVGGKCFRIQDSELVPIELSSAIAEENWPSPDGKYTVYAKKWMPGEKVAEAGGLWCRSLSSGVEVKLSDTWWNDPYHNWAIGWIGY